MSEEPTPDDLKKAYQLGLSNARFELKMSVIVEKLGISNTKARKILTKLAVSRAASQPAATGSGDFIVLVREQDLALRLRKIDNEETYLAFCAVEKSGTAGIGTREILKYCQEKLLGLNRGVMNVNTSTVGKSIRQLEAEKIIKTIKSVHNKTRKLYIVANLEADSSVVGGIFYKDGEFDYDMVDAFRDRIMQYVSSHGQVPLKNILAFLKSSGFREDLSEADIAKIFKTLILDQQLVCTIHPQSGEFYYTPSRWPDYEEVERLPCVSCPVQSTCQIEDLDRFDSLLLRQSLFSHKKINAGESKLAVSIGMGAVSEPPKSFTSKVVPSNCPYLSQWLGLGILNEPVVKPPDETPQQDEA